MQVIQRKIADLPFLHSVDAKIANALDSFDAPGLICIDCGQEAPNNRKQCYSCRRKDGVVFRSNDCTPESRTFLILDCLKGASLSPFSNVFSDNSVQALFKKMKSVYDSSLPRHCSMQAQCPAWILTKAAIEYSHFFLGTFSGLCLDFFRQGKATTFSDVLGLCCQCDGKVLLSCHQRELMVRS